MKLLSTFLVLALCVGVKAQVIAGRVFCGDSVPASYATVYAPETGLVAMAGFDGRYELNCNAASVLRVEFSSMGFRSQLVNVNPIVAGDTLWQDVCLLPLSFTGDAGGASSFTPQAVLRNVARQSCINRNRFVNYEVSSVYSFWCKDFDLVSLVGTSAGVNSFRLAAILAGWGPFLDHCFSSPQVFSSIHWDGAFVSGRMSITSKEILPTSSFLPDSARQAFLELNFLDADLYNSVYSYVDEWLARSSAAPFRIVGKYSGVWGNVFVLACENDGLGRRLTLHVLEDAWSVLCMEVSDDMTNVRTECRPVLPGLLMPISVLSCPKVQICSRWDVESKAESLARAHSRLGSAGHSCGRSSGSDDKVCRALDLFSRKVGSDVFLNFAIGHCISYHSMR